MKIDRYPNTSCICILPEKQDLNKFYKVEMREITLKNLGKVYTNILQVVATIPDRNFPSYPYIYRVILSNDPNLSDHINLVNDYVISIEEIKEEVEEV